MNKNCVLATSRLRILVEDAAEPLTKIAVDIIGIVEVLASGDVGRVKSSLSSLREKSAKIQEIRDVLSGLTKQEQALTDLVCLVQQTAKWFPGAVEVIPPHCQVVLTTYPESLGGALAHLFEARLKAPEHGCTVCFVPKRQDGFRVIDIKDSNPVPPKLDGGVEIANMLIRELGGLLKWQSFEGDGTRFAITVPNLG